MTIISINWNSDTVIVTAEKETISPLTLAAIIVGSVAVAFDLLFRNWLLITYSLWIYSWFKKTGTENDDPRKSVVSRGKKEASTSNFSNRNQLAIAQKVKRSRPE